MRSINVSLAVAALALVGTARTASAQVSINLLNPSFEDVSVALVNGEHAPKNWVSSSYSPANNSAINAQAIFNGDFGKTYTGVSGGNYLALGYLANNFGTVANSTTSVAQKTNSVLAGGAYAVSFKAGSAYFYSNAFNSNQAGILQVSLLAYNAAGTVVNTLGTASFDESLITAGTFAAKSVVFTVPFSSTDVLSGNEYFGLQFSNTASGKVALVDGVSVVYTTPEPGTYAMLAGMVITTGGFMVRRRRNK